MADLQRKTANLFDVLDYTDIQTSTNGGASNVVKTSSTISFKSNGENDYSGIYVPFNYYSTHINDYNISTTYTLSADVYTDVPCTIIFGGSATIVSIPAGTSRLSYRFLGNITLAFYIRNTTANITLSKIMFAINDTTYEPYYPHSLRKLTTATDTFTTLPVDVYTDGNNATVGLKGNTVQSGTPTPDNPIMPQGTGEMTGNLFDDVTESGYYNDSGTLVQDTTASHSTNYIPVNGATYTVSGLWYSAVQMANFAVYEWDNNKNWLRRSNRQFPPSSNKITFTIGTDTAYITLQVQTEHGNIMLNTGSTPLPYEPYGIEIPISSGGNNLFDKDSTQYSTVGYMRDDGTFGENNNYGVSGYIQLSPNTQYTVSDMNVNGLYPAICFYTDNKTFISGIKYNGLAVLSFTTPINCKYVLMSYLKSNINNIMLNLGATALPYEPYNHTTTPVYLGEVESTRVIKKLVLTGEEGWYISTTWKLASTSVFYFNSWDIFNKGYSEIFILSDKFEAASRNELYNEDSDMIARTGTNSITIRVSDSIATTVANFESYLAAQYANGTPVTVWYVLAEPTTGIVNEPLMKIGDYADTVSGITIPTITGKDIFDVETTLKPSEASLSYTGWHDASVYEAVQGNNLFDYTTMATSAENSYLNTDGTIGTSNDWNITAYIPCDGTSFTVGDIGGNTPAICLYNANKEYITGKSYNTGGTYSKQAVNITSQTTAKFIRFSYCKGSLNPDDISAIMLNSGSTLLPYEPYSIHWE